jgi:hypothetical protein
MEKRLREGAGDVHRHALTERIDQADLILDRATMTLRDRPAGAEKEPHEQNQTLHIP